MKALSLSTYEYRTRTHRDTVKQDKHITFKMLGETMSVIIGIIIILVGIAASAWESGYQEQIIKAISQTFI